MCGELRASLLRLGWLWRLTPHDIGVFMDIYTCNNAMGRVVMDWEWESYDKLLDAGWVRIVNEVMNDDGSVTIVLKSNTLDDIVSGLEAELNAFVLGVEQNIEGVRSLIPVHHNCEVGCRVCGKGEVYKFVKKKEKLSDIIKHDALIVEKYIP